MSIIDKPLNLGGKVSKWAIDVYVTLVSKHRWFAVLVAWPIPVIIPRRRWLKWSTTARSSASRVSWP